MWDTLKRGLYHISGGLSIAIAALFLPRIVLLVLLGLATFIFLTFDFLRFRVSSVNSWFFRHFRSLLRETEASHLNGSSYILMASLVLFLAFERDIAVLALSFLAVGDAMATIVGKQIGKLRFLGRPMEGNMACFVSCVATGFVFYWAGLDIPLLMIMVGSLGATVVQAIPLPINDNLTIPIFAGLVMTLTQLLAG
jgi:glycerol-3-phosphate acyltransferase PlsY